MEKPVSSPTSGPTATTSTAPEANAEAAEPAEAESEASDPQATPGATVPAAKSGAALRNENVFASKLDNDSQKADNIRLGINYVIVAQPQVESNYYGAEHGKTPSDTVVLGRPAKSLPLHAELFEMLQNSSMNARTFFQVGSVLPSRSNNYGLRFGGKVAGLGNMTGAFSQTKNRGMVNGNVLVPLPSERTPTATDPAVRSIIQRFLNAYPAMAPNRPDFDPRALNTNGPETINGLDTNLRLDRTINSKGQVSLSHSLGRQYIEAFQLVAGDNPFTVLHSQRARVTYRYSANEANEYGFGLGFNRSRANLFPAPGAVGPRVRIGRSIETLGPDAQYPLDRVENTFRIGAVGFHRGDASKHRVTFGGELVRYQLNGFEQLNQRGDLQFSDNFGRTAIQNLLAGVPTSLHIVFGDMHRGFRSWSTNLFVADQWTIHPRLQLYVGLRHGMDTAPTEQHNRNSMPYGADWNNFAPRFSLVYRAPWDWFVRASYSMSYGQVLPVTYSQIRYNLPDAVSIQVSNPDLLDPLKGIDINAAEPRSSPTVFSPNLVAPYEHQYNFSMQRTLGRIARIELGYVGSRSLKLLTAYTQNRGEPIPGVPQTTATLDQRRPDPRYYDVIRIVNGGIAYLDAAQANWTIPTHRGFSSGGSFTFSKAIDTGTTYTSTAANRDLNAARSQWQYDSQKEKKALSDFDSTRALSFYLGYEFPRFRGLLRPLDWLERGWQVNASLTIRTGTPFYLMTGSDAPGFGNVDGSGSDRPNILDPSILGATVGDPDTSAQILQKSRFSFLAPGQRAGNLGYNTFRKHGIRNMNASISREWRWGAQQPYSLRFQAEAFNLGNHPQFDAPQYVLSAPSFGKITNTLNSGRVLQLSLRFSR